MSKKEFTLQELLNWCEKQASAGKELTMIWEGGGDSGWVHFEIDEDTTSEPEAEELVDMMYEMLDYGSWAGEFSASGEATYDRELKAFLGTDFYSESASDTTEAKIEVRVPVWLPFSDMEITTEDDKINVRTKFHITNGFEHPRTREIEDTLNETLQPKFSEAVDQAIEKTGQEFESTWQTYRLERKDFVVDGDELVHVIEEVHYGYFDESDRDIVINLAELLKEEEEENGL